MQPRIDFMTNPKRSLRNLFLGGRAHQPARRRCSPSPCPVLCFAQTSAVILLSFHSSNGSILPPAYSMPSPMGVSDPLPLLSYILRPKHCIGVHRTIFNVPQLLDRGLLDSSLLSVPFQRLVGILPSPWLPFSLRRLSDWTCKIRSTLERDWKARRL